MVLSNDHQLINYSTGIYMTRYKHTVNNIKVTYGMIIITHWLKMLKKNTYSKSMKIYELFKYIYFLGITVYFQSHSENVTVLSIKIHLYADIKC